MTCPDSVQIPSNRWLKFMSGRRRKRGRLFGDAPEAPRVSPKPYARSRATRPPTVNRPASAIPLTETCAASETRRVARLRAASCATPASLPSASPRPGHGRDLRRLPIRDARVRFGTGRGSAFRAEAAEARGESRRVFRARRDWRRAGSPRGAEAEAKASGSIHLAESCRRYPPSRQASFAKQNGYSGVPEKARSELLPAPQRRATGLPAFAQSGNPG